MKQLKPTKRFILKTYLIEKTFASFFTLMNHSCHKPFHLKKLFNLLYRLKKIKYKSSKDNIIFGKSRHFNKQQKRSYKKNN